MGRWFSMVTTFLFWLWKIPIITYNLREGEVLYSFCSFESPLCVLSVCMYGVDVCVIMVWPKKGSLSIFQLFPHGFSPRE